MRELRGKGSPVRVQLLKSTDFAAWRAAHACEPAASELPYGIEHLAGHELDLRWKDAPPGPRGSLVHRLDRRVPPFMQTLRSASAIAGSDVVLAMFESEGHFLAIVRALKAWPFTRPRLVVISCWLAELLVKRYSPRRIALLRRAYRHVDRLVFFSRNQAEIYQRVLGVPPERLRFVPFGIDHRYFSPGPPEEVENFVLAVGRDLGRDWATLFEAVAGTSLRVKLATRPSALQGLAVPSNVEVLGQIGLRKYRDLTRKTGLVVVPCVPQAYPTGQTVLLESMAAARCCVVTGSPAMEDYLDPGTSALVVPPRDPAALRAALLDAAGSPELRARLGNRARQLVEERYNAPAMWGRVREILLELCSEPR